MRRSVLYGLVALAVLALSAVPIGLAVFWLGFVNGDSPCVMCWEQRIGMALVALAGLFVLRYGPRPRYLGLAVLVGAWGIHMGLRHTAMHAARDVGQGFSIEILGAHTYTWSLLIFWVAVVTIGLLLALTRPEDITEAPRRLGKLGALAAAVYLVVIAGNIVQAFASTGPPPFMGQSDPVRFSFNPKHWAWSLEEWSPIPVSLRGRWAIEKPDLTALPADPEAGPIEGLPMIAAAEQRRIALPLKGAITDLAYDPATDRFLLTTEHGVYLVDSVLERVLRYTVVDPGYSVDLGRFAGAAFLDSRTVVALGENKSYVVLREDDEADAAANFRFFLESFDRFSEVRRSRLGTVRARMMYTMSLAFDPARDSLFTATVPNAKVRQLVVSRFDRSDFTLSEEFLPGLRVGSGLGLRAKDRSLGEYYVTGLTIADGLLYAVSAAYRTLLVVDPAERVVVAAVGLPGPDRPTGVAARGEHLYLVSGDGRLVVVPRPAGMRSAASGAAGGGS